MQNDIGLLHKMKYTVTQKNRHWWCTL